VILLYAIAPSAAGLSVLQTEGLCLHDDGELAAFFEHRAGAPDRTMKEVMSFGRTLQLIWRRTSLLPIRFGTEVHDEAELAALLDEHRQEWLARLRTVCDRSELIVHLPKAEPVPAEQLPAAAGSGRDYLGAIAERVRAENRVIDELRDLLAPFAEAERALPAVEGPRRAFLVANDNVEAAESAVAEWVDRAGLHEVRVTGPWPPFSFCGEVEP